MRRIEAELWYRDKDRSRAATLQRISEIVAKVGGEIIDRATIVEICYQAVLIDIPATEIERFSEREEVHLLVCDDIMFLRPQSSMDVWKGSFELQREAEVPDEEPSTAPPIAALLDGVPVQNHVLLDGRLAIDDPDELERMSTVASRHHGTAMASLILHGDRNIMQRALSRPLHVRPVLYAPINEGDEQPNQNRLLIDVIYRAIKRIREGDDEGEATAPEVFLVNLSLGDRGRPFTRVMSPWAKLLDYLAEHYGILFLVSAGNIKEPLPINQFKKWAEFEDANPEDREWAVLSALLEQKAFRTLLSPAEALNPITIGAMHDDAVDDSRGSAPVDPYATRELPNVSSALGLGHRKVIKPDIYLPGGREHVHCQVSDGSLVVIPNFNGPFGLASAAPDEAGNLAHTRLTMGTSAATALATRWAHLIFDALMDGDGGSLHTDLDAEFRAVVVKALLVHRATWGGRAMFLNEHCGPRGRGTDVQRRDDISRLLGYGFPNIEESLSCAPNRATLVGYGTIAAGESRVHGIPLPPSLERVQEPRTLTVTVAWFSPINPRHQVYRCAKLTVATVSKIQEAAGVSRSSGQPSDTSVNRGTVWHTQYEGDKAVAFVDDGHVVLQIHCRGQAGAPDKDIRYGLAVTIEAGEGIAVYDEVRARLAVRARPRAS